MKQIVNVYSIKFNRVSKALFSIILCLYTIHSIAQSDGPEAPNVKDYKNDSTYQKFNKLRFKVAKAQIIKLKNEGALLVRLKTNANTINRLKAAGNNDLATQVERETELSNKIVMLSYKHAFTFCPVYFFYSSYSDSVKHKKLTAILLDSTLRENGNVVCDKSFYLIADEGTLYNSSLGLVTEEQAPTAKENGAPGRDAIPIVIKNRFYVQLHKPFPYFQIKGESSLSNENEKILTELQNLYNQYNKVSKSNSETKRLKKFKGCVKLLNKSFDEFYNESKDFVVPNDINKYVY